MDDKAYAELQLKAAICPHQSRWPREPLYGQLLHAVADEARDRVSRVFERMDEIDGDTGLSTAAKADERHKVAGDSLAEFETSKTLARAREAVSCFIERWKRDEQHVSTEIAEAALKAMKEADTRSERVMRAS